MLTHTSIRSAEIRWAATRQPLHGLGIGRVGGHGQGRRAELLALGDYLRQHVERGGRPAPGGPVPGKREGRGPPNAAGSTRDDSP
ncbi:MAG: hypothetical protein WKG07_29240 [Hymenobacter sp.]